MQWIGVLAINIGSQGGVSSVLSSVCQMVFVYINLYIVKHLYACVFVEVVGCLCAPLYECVCVCVCVLAVIKMANILG